MIAPGWQQDTIQTITNLLQPRADVLALAVFGSSSTAALDLWSDIDLLIVLQPDALDTYFANLDWLRTLGEIFTHESSSNPFTKVLRVCFTDFRRLDIVLTTESDLLQIDQWPLVPFYKGIHVLFSRSELITQILNRTFTSPELHPMTAEQFAAFANQFWFKATLAVTKIARDDLLIALHLALDLLRDCCVVGMILRDRAEGTNHHRHGGIGKQFVSDLPTPSPDYTAANLLNFINRCTHHFDTLAAQWDSTYSPHYPTFATYLETTSNKVTNSQNPTFSPNPP